MNFPLEKTVLYNKTIFEKPSRLEDLKKSAWNLKTNKHWNVERGEKEYKKNKANNPPKPNYTSQTQPTVETFAFGAGVGRDIRSIIYPFCVLVPTWNDFCTFFLLFCQFYFNSFFPSVELLLNENFSNSVFLGLYFGFDLGIDQIRIMIVSVCTVCTFWKWKLICYSNIKLTNKWGISVW